MGISGKHHRDAATLDSDGRKWVIAGIQLRAPLKPIYTLPAVDKDEEEESPGSTTPTAADARIPPILPCPPPPRKRKASLKCNYGRAREFFNPPDLETIFVRHACRKG